MLFLLFLSLLVMQTTFTMDSSSDTLSLIGDKYAGDVINVSPDTKQDIEMGDGDALEISDADFVQRMDTLRLSSHIDLQKIVKSGLIKHKEKKTSSGASARKRAKRMVRYFDARTTKWLTDAAQAYDDHQKMKPITQAPDECIIRHQMPLLIEKKYFSYAVVPQDQPNAGEVRAYLPGALIIDGQSYGGFYEFTLNPDTKVVYHRCFKSPARFDKAGYPAEVRNAECQTRKTWQDVKDLCVLTPTVETAVIKADDIVISHKGHRGTLRSVGCDDIVRTYDVKTVTTSEPDYQFSVPKISIRDQEIPGVIFDLHTGYVPTAALCE
jgi:hypothetical protein